MKKSCRTCEHYDLERVKTKTGRVMSGSVAQCKWDTGQIVLPSSVLKGLGARFHKSYMQPTDGTDCACWTPIKPKE